MKLFKDSLTINKDLYEFLEEINYGLSGSQFNNLYSLVEGILTVKGSKSIRRIANEILTSPSCGALYSYLRESNWDTELIERNRVSLLNMFFENNVKTKKVAFIAIDDTVNAKKKAISMEGLSFNHSHTEGKRIKSHCVVNAHFICEKISMPLNHKLYLSKDNCAKYDRQFKGKPDIAIEFVENFNSPTNCTVIYYLVDSWYSSEKLIHNCLKNQAHLIGTIKSNRLITCNFTRMQAGQFFKALPQEIFDVVTVEGTKYKVFEFDSLLGKSDIKIKVVFSYEVKENGDIFPIYLISTDLSLSAEQIISYYLKRWDIEVGYKHFKSDLGFDEYKVQSLTAIERYMLIVYLAMNFLQIYRYRDNRQSKTLGECISEIIKVKFQSIVNFVYTASAEGYPLKEIYSALKIPVGISIC